MSRRVVITGMGVVSPCGSGLGAFESALKKARSGITQLSELAEFGVRAQIGGIPDESESDFHTVLSTYDLEDAPSFVRYAVIAAVEAWSLAGLSLPGRESNRLAECGAIVGNMMGASDFVGDKMIPAIRNERMKGLRGRMVEKTMNSAPAAIIAGIFGLGNRVATNSSACATGTEAIAEAFRHIKFGQADRMLAGGTEGFSKYSWASYDVMRITARKFNEQPELASRPMSADPVGFVPAAGAGILVLESLESAQARGANILAEINGAAVNCGGQRSGGTMTAPNQAAQKECIKLCLQDAGIDASEIDYINGHLTSTMADVLELESWAQVLNRNGDDFPYVNATKSLTGHTIGAAGGIEMVAALLQLNQQFLHASINCAELHPKIEAMGISAKVVRELQQSVSIKSIAKSSFGFGDVNACLIVSRNE